MTSTDTRTKADIIRQQVSDNQRINVTAKLFGAYFPLRLEPFVYGMTSRLSDDYSGGSVLGSCVSNWVGYIGRMRHFPFSGKW